MKYKMIVKANGSKETSDVVTPVINGKLEAYEFYDEFIEKADFRTATVGFHLFDESNSLTYQLVTAKGNDVKYDRDEFLRLKMK